MLCCMFSNAVVLRVFFCKSRWWLGITQQPRRVQQAKLSRRQHPRLLLILFFQTYEIFWSEEMNQDKCAKICTRENAFLITQRELKCCWTSKNQEDDALCCGETLCSSLSGFAAQNRGIWDKMTACNLSNMKNYPSKCAKTALRRQCVANHEAVFSGLDAVLCLGWRIFFKVWMIYGRIHDRQIYHR